MLSRIEEGVRKKLQSYLVDEIQTNSSDFTRLSSTNLNQGYFQSKDITNIIYRINCNNRLYNKFLKKTGYCHQARVKNCEAWLSDLMVEEKQKIIASQETRNSLYRIRILNMLLKTGFQFTPENKQIIIDWLSGTVSSSLELLLFQSQTDISDQYFHFYQVEIDENFKNELDQLLLKYYHDICELQLYHAIIKLQANSRRFLTKTKIN